MTEPGRVWRKFQDPGHYTPEFKLTVPGDGDDECTLEVGWHLSEGDASVWRRPISLTISPVFPPTSAPDEQKKRAADQSWETTVDLSREDARMLRDYLDLLLRCPDLRQHDGEVSVHLHTGP